MYHSRMRGTHYEAGRRYGEILYKNGADPLCGVPRSAARSEFARRCIPVYEEFYPEILGEMRGIAEGLHTDCRDVTDFLLSMYCFVGDICCSVFAFSSGGKTIFGRNSDFLTRVEKICDSAYYRLDGAYSFIGNTTAWTEIEDGVNKYGLAAGLTVVYPTVTAPGMNAGLIVRYLLERCRTTGEALEALRRLPHASQHTITLADRGGDIAVVECNCKKISVRRPTSESRVVFTTNHFVSPEMQRYQYDGEDDIHSHERYETLARAFQSELNSSVDFAKELLSGKKGFLCQYDRKRGMDTIWSSVYDLTDRTVYRVEGNPSRKSFKLDNRLRLEHPNNSD